MIHRLVFSRGGALLGALATLAAAGLAIPATAAAGNVTSLTSCGQPITVKGGMYRLDADVTGTATCFQIDANNVNLMLNGHTIKGSGVAFASGIETKGSMATITGPGTVTGWTGFDGIDLEGARGSVRGVTATGNGDGIDLDSTGNDVRGNVTTGNEIGIIAESGATGNTIIGNSAHNNTFVDLADNNDTCDSNVWLGNDFGTAGGPGSESCIH